MELKSIQEATNVLRKAQDALRSADVGVTATQVAVLSYIADADEMPTLGAIAKHIDVTPAVVTGLVDRLERVKAIERVKANGDRRTVHLRLTDRGADILIDAETALRAVA